MSRTLRRAILVLATVALFGSAALLDTAFGQNPVIRRQIQIAIPPAVVPLPVPNGPGGIAAEADDPSEFSHAISLPKDNQLKKQIEAAKDYIATEDWVTACDVLQKLVTIREDVFVQLPRKGPEGKERLVWTSVRAEANRLIATLPRKGLEFYKLTYNPPALDMLKQAKAKSDVSMLAQVMRAYLHTDPGGEATNLLGTYHLDRGNFVTAALCFERLLQRDGVNKQTPLTLFKAAYAFHQAGDKGNEDHVWRMLHARTREVKLGAEARGVSELQDYVAKLVRANAERNLHDWPMVGGKETRSSQGIGGTAFLEPRWKASMIPTLSSTESASFDAVNGLLQQAENLLRDKKQPILPAFFPVTATVNQDGQKLPLIVYRSHWGLHALDMKTGKLKWQTPSYGSLAWMLKGGQDQHALNQWLAFYVQSNQRPGILFENSTVGTVSTDNSLVYMVEDLAVPPPAQYQNGMNFDPRFNPGGGARFGAGVQDKVLHSKLQAFDLVNGKIHWQLGGRGEKDPLSDCYFLGPPLPLAGKIYVLTEKQQELRLVCVNPVFARTATGSWVPRVESVQTLATTRDKMQQDVARRTEAAHLAYGEGILVCPTNAGAVLGVDLLSNSLVWAYPYREKGDQAEMATAAVGVGRGRIIRPGWVIGADGRPFTPTQNSHWKVAPPIIADGKVVFTAPDARSVHCISLRDGSPLWTRSRTEDDLYLAGVFNGKVVIVGKKNVRGLSLNNKGETVWTVDTGVPSGQGIASDNIYYLPLREAGQQKEPEICAIDVDAGRIIAHTKSRKREVPGNLLFYEGDVLSQTPTEVAAFPQLKVKLAQIDELITKNPEDPVGLTERGELRLDEGNLEGAIADLTKAMKHNPDQVTLAKARAKLYDTLTEYFQLDFNQAEPYLATYEGLCKVDGAGAASEQEKADRQAEERRRRANFLCLVAKGKESQRKLVEAFEKYQEFVAVAGNQELISVVDERSVQAAPDVWSQGRIAAMVASATPAERKPLEERIARQWQELKTKNDMEALRRFVAVFGSLFPVGKEARLHLAERLMEDSDPRALIDAERHLSLLRGPHETREVAARAVEALARLNVSKGLFEDAAYFYRLLGRRYPDVVVREGRTGADLFNEMATDKRLQPYLDPPMRLGHVGKIKVIEERGGYPYQNQTYHFAQAGEPLPFFQNNRLALRTDYHQLKIFDRGNGEERWSQNLTKTMFANLVYGNGQPNMAKFKFQTLGHLVVLPVGHMVFAIDPVNKQVLWEKNLYANANPLPGQAVNPPGYNQLIVDPRDGSIQVIYPDGWTQRLGQMGPLKGSAVCLQTREALVAVDPISGRTLWTRSDISPRSHIFGDEQNLFVVEVDPQTNAAVATRALRAYDGVTVKVPDFAPLYQKRLRMVGRDILLSEADATGAVTLRLYDVLSGKDLWKEGFPANTVQLHSEENDLAGAITPDGKVRVFNLPERREVLSSLLPIQDYPDFREDVDNLKKATAIHLLADGDDFYIAYQLPTDQNLMAFGGVMTNLMPGAGLRALPVNGPVYAFHRKDGRFHWRNKIENQMLVLEQFEDVPMLLFTARWQRWQINGPARNVVQEVAVESRDKRTGKLLYENKNVPNGMNFHALTIDARAGKIEFVGYQMKITHLLNSDAAAAAKVGMAPRSGSTAVRIENAHQPIQVFPGGAVRIRVGPALPPPPPAQPAITR
jgi:outer membrane protein assembly factor BamB